jgi:RHS repeat-associated protein
LQWDRVEGVSRRGRWSIGRYAAWALILSLLVLVSPAAAGTQRSSRGPATARRHATRRRRATRRAQHGDLGVRRPPRRLLARPGTRRVDLAMGSVQPQGGGALPGRSFAVVVQVKRIGRPRTRLRSIVSVYLASHRKLKGRRPAVAGSGEVGLSPKGKGKASLTVTVPIGTAPGRYFVVACVASLGRFHDHGARNDCAASRTPVTVGTAQPAGPSGSLEATPNLPAREPTGSSPPPNTPVPVEAAPPAPGPADRAAPSAAQAANSLSASESTSFRESIAFLFTGAEPIQRGVGDPSVITEAAAALLHGVVTDTSGHPIGGVRVAILGHDEYGYTDTAADGSFAMAVDGGQTLTVSYARAGYIPIQSTVQVIANQAVAAPAAALSAFQGQADDIDLTSSRPIQVAQGGVESDASGTRRATLLFSAGTHATMHMPDESTRPLTDLHVRATEFTVGAYGSEAMPGSLPPTSDYTYAADFSVDQAVEVGATSLTFDKPVISYVDNFLGLPTGAEVPSGDYDPNVGQWGASGNGVVVRVLSTSGGVAQLAVDASGEAASQEELQELGISQDELQAIASLYKPGDSLWRMPITHFSSWDFNFLPENERPEPPPPPSNENPPEDESCHAPGGSTILCDSRALAEDVPVSATPLTLHYQSDRVAGYAGANAIVIPVTASNQVPASVDHIDLDVDILGRTYHKEYCMPGGKGCESGAEQVASGHATGLEYDLVWDHRDGFGRLVTGGATANVTVTYWVGATYQCTMYTTGGGGNPSEFGATYESEGGCGTAARELTPVADSEQVQVGQSANASGAGLGEWDLSVHDSYDPRTGVLHSGDGSDTSVQTVAPVLSNLAGGGGEEGDGGRATDASLDFPQGVLERPDGSVLIADCGASKVREVMPDGTISTFAGTGQEGDSGDGGPATAATLDCPSSLALAPDGSVYVADALGDPEGKTLEELSGRIRKIAPDGTISTVAGGGSLAPQEAIGRKATDVELFYPGQIALGPDGSLYIADRGNGDVERVDAGGILSIVDYDEESGTTRGVENPEGVAVTGSGEVIVTDGPDNKVLRIAGGTTTVLAGTGESGHSGDGGAATQAAIESPGPVDIGPNGTVYFAEDSFPGRVRAVSSTGTITTVAGGGVTDPSEGGIPATAASLVFIGGLYANSDGSLLISDGIGHVYRMKTSLAGVSDGNLLVPTDNGSRIDEFTAGGRELAVYDSTTDVKLLSFGYDSAGRLSEVGDQYGLRTTIERNASGTPTAIVAPGGQRTSLSLDPNGRLQTVTDPLGHEWAASYDGSGQLSGLRDPNGDSSAIAYDALGRLESDTDQAGATTTLSSSFDSEGGHVVTVHLPDGRTASYDDRQDGYGLSTRTIVDPTGGETSYTTYLDGYAWLTLPDGTEEFTENRGDPRFGMAAPIVKSLEIETPGGANDVSLSESRTVHLAEADNPLSLSELTESISVDGDAPMTSTYDAATRTVTTRSPGGRLATATYDSHDDLVSTTGPFSALPTQLSWDVAHGELTHVAQGSRSKTLEYDPAGNLQKVTSGAGHSHEYSTDASGRVQSATDQLGHSYQLGYDPNGDLTSVKAPSGAESKLGYTPVGLPGSFLAPTQTTGLSTEYDGQRRPTKLTLPGGRTLEETYDSAGRLAETSAADGDLAIGYVPNTSHPTTLERTNADGQTETLSPTFDGDTITGLAFSGPASGSYSYRYSDGRVTEMSLEAGGAGEADTSLSYDEDGLLSESGPFNIARDSSSGLASELGDGTFSESLGYDEYGVEADRSFSVEGTPIYSEKLGRDSSGRIVSAEDTVAGTVKHYEYVHDAAGRLREVIVGGSPSESYAYDGDGDLTSRQSGGSGEEQLSYDGQGRETKLGSTTYQYDADGQLAARGADTFDYGVRGGELESATVGGKTVTYDYDALGRRVARTQEGETEQYLYGDPEDPNRLTASIAPGGTLTAYTYDDIGRLISFERGAATYYVATDYIGSPRVVVDSAGNVVKKLTYDAYGRVLENSAPGFALDVGYAGGLSDPLTRLVRFGARDYDPASGRFTERDATLYRGGLNLYAYAGEDPVDFIDPDGTSSAREQLDNAKAELAEAEAPAASEPPPPPSLVERAGNYLAGLRDKAADKVGELVQACKSFVNGTTPQSAIPLLKEGIGKAAGEGPFEVTPAFMAQETLERGATIIQSSPAGMGSMGNNQYAQVEDGH